MSRRFFYWRLSYRLAEERWVRSLRSADPDMSASASFAHLAGRLKQLVPLLGKH